MMGWRLLCVAICGLTLLACGQRVPNERAPITTQLCSDDFRSCVNPIFSRQIRRRGGAVVSCSDSNCHAPGGSGGRFTLGANEDSNFLAASNFIDRGSPDASLLLVEPTQDDVSPSPVAAFHGGGEIFPSQNDECYKAIRAWISNAGACGSCVPVPNSTICGYP